MGRARRRSLEAKSLPSPGLAMAHMAEQTALGLGRVKGGGSKGWGSKGGYQQGLGSWVRTGRPTPQQGLDCAAAAGSLHECAADQLQTHPRQESLSAAAQLLEVWMQQLLQHDLLLLVNLLMPCQPVLLGLRKLKGPCVVLVFCCLQDWQMVEGWWHLQALLGCLMGL